MLGGIGGRRRGRQKMRWLDGITDSMDMSMSELRSWWWTGSLGCCDSWGRKELDTTERLNWTELNWAPSPCEVSEVLLALWGSVHQCSVFPSRKDSSFQVHFHEMQLGLAWLMYGLSSVLYYLLLLADIALMSDLRRWSQTSSLGGRAVGGLHFLRVKAPLDSFSKLLFPLVTCP